MESVYITCIIAIKGIFSFSLKYDRRIKFSREIIKRFDIKLNDELHNHSLFNSYFFITQFVKFVLENTRRRFSTYR